jgi:hypothetical protein
MAVQHHGNHSLLQQDQHSAETAIKLGAFTLYVLSGYWFLERVAIPRFDRIFVLNSEEECVIRLTEKEKVLRLTMDIDFNGFVQTNKDAARDVLGLAPDKRGIPSS